MAKREWQNEKSEFKFKLRGRQTGQKVYIVKGELKIHTVVELKDRQKGKTGRTESIYM